SLNGIVAFAVLIGGFRPHAAGLAYIGVVAIDGATHINAENIALPQNLIFDAGKVATAADGHMHPVNLPSGSSHLAFVDSGKLALFNSRLRGLKHGIDRLFIE